MGITISWAFISGRKRKTQRTACERMNVSAVLTCDQSLFPGVYIMSERGIFFNIYKNLQNGQITLLLTARKLVK